MPRYSLNDFNSIIFNGFDIELSEETLHIINDLAMHVGSPTYVKTPVFNKKSIVEVNDQTDYKRKKRNKESDSDSWISGFHATPVAQKSGIDMQIDSMRSALNKLTDKNYADQCNKIMEILHHVADEEGDNMIDNMYKISVTIFDIASNNRFYSKLYADLYSNLIDEFCIMKDILETNLLSFLKLFELIESADADKEYDKFCRINKDNEKRKALGLFIVNLTVNKIIKSQQLHDITFGLFKQVLDGINYENKRPEVDELTENIAILYNKDMFTDCALELDGMKFADIINMLAHTNIKLKKYPGLTTKAVFKYLDIFETK